MKKYRSKICLHEENQWYQNRAKIINILILLQKISYQLFWFKKV